MRNFGDTDTELMPRLVVLLLFLFSALFCSAQQEITFNGNTFGMSAAKTIMVKDPVTGNAEQQSIPARPIAMNGKPIYTTDTLTRFPVFNEKGAPGTEKLSGYLFTILKAELGRLDEGNYILSVTNAVIDEKGRLVYYEFGGLKRLQEKTVFSSASGGRKNDAAIYDHVENIPTDIGIDSTLKQPINSAAQKALDNLPKMKPAQVDGKNVRCTGPVFSTWNFIIVKDHKAIFTPYPDCL